MHYANARAPHVRSTHAHSWTRCPKARPHEPDPCTQPLATEDRHTRQHHRGGCPYPTPEPQQTRSLLSPAPTSARPQSTTTINTRGPPRTRRPQPPAPRNQPSRAQSPPHLASSASIIEQVELQLIGRIIERIANARSTKRHHHCSVHQLTLCHQLLHGATITCATHRR